MKVENMKFLDSGLLGLIARHYEIRKCGIAGYWKMILAEKFRSRNYKLVTPGVYIYNRLNMKK